MLTLLQSLLLHVSSLYVELVETERLESGQRRGIEVVAHPLNPPLRLPGTISNLCHPLSWNVPTLDVPDMLVVK